MSKYDKLYEDIKAGTNIIAGDEYKNILYGISQVASDMVVKTLGPGGKTTLLDDSMFVYPTKDGYNVLNRLRFTDPIQNSLFNTLRQISFTIVNKVGDGTTTALVGANAFLKKMLDYEENNSFRQADLIKTIEKVKTNIVNELKNGNEIQVIDTEGDFSDIYKIALVSSNNNEILAEMIRSIYQETDNPNIYITLDQGNSLSYEIQNGYKVDCKVINHKAYINEDNGTCKKTEPTFVAIFDHSVTYNEHGQLLTMMSRYAASKNREFVVFAPYFDDVITTMIGTSINSMLQKGQIPNIMMVQVPLTMEVQRQYMSDMVLLTNAQVFDIGKVRLCNILVSNQSLPEDEQIDDPILHIEEYNFSTPEDVIGTCLGVSTNLTVADKYVIFQEYDRVANATVLKNTLDEARALYDAAKEKAHKSTSVLNKDYMDAYQRYTKLVGKMGVIKVGGISELEKHCLKDAVDDAVLACKAAYDNGYVKGLNISLLRAIKRITPILSNVEKTTSLEYQICEMFYKTFEEVSMLVMGNTYADTVKRAVKFKFSDRTTLICSVYKLNHTIFNLNNAQILQKCVEENIGYNLIDDTFELANDCSVINSVSTDIEILNAIVGILSLMLTSDQFLSVNRTYDRKTSKQQAIEIISAEKAEIATAVIKAILSLDKEIIEKSPLFKAKGSVKQFFKNIFSK